MACPQVLCRVRTHPNRHEGRHGRPYGTANAVPYITYCTQVGRVRAEMEPKAVKCTQSSQGSGPPRPRTGRRLSAGSAGSGSLCPAGVWRPAVPARPAPRPVQAGVRPVSTTIRAPVAAACRAITCAPQPQRGERPGQLLAVEPHERDPAPAHDTFQLPSRGTQFLAVAGADPEVARGRDLTRTGLQRGVVERGERVAGKVRDGARHRQPCGCSPGLPRPATRRRCPVTPGGSGGVCTRCRGSQAPRPSSLRVRAVQARRVGRTAVRQPRSRTTQAVAIEKFRSVPYAGSSARRPWPSLSHAPVRAGRSCAAPLLSGAPAGPHSVPLFGQRPGPGGIVVAGGGKRRRAASGERPPVCGKGGQGRRAGPW